VDAPGGRGCGLVSLLTDTPELRKIFISHSANDDAFAARVRDVVTARLRERGYEVLVDTDALVVGEDWAPQLYQWLEECQSAIILLSHKALASIWVRREINILLWRRSRNPSLLVVPALLAVGSAAVEAAGMSELEPVQAAKCPGTTDADVELVVEAITARFAETTRASGDDPLCRWLRRVTRALHTVPQSERDVLKRAARFLGVPEDMPVEWGREEACRLLAAQFLGAGLRGRRLEHALWAVAESLDSGPFRKLRTDALPSWVDAEAARRVLPPRRGVDPHRMTVFLDLNDLILAGDYLARAMCRAVPDYDYVALEVPSTSEFPADEVLDGCRSAVRRMLCLDDDEVLSPTAERPEDKIHYLLVHPGEAPGSAVASALVALHGECPWLVVVALGASGRLTPDLLVQAGVDDLVLVEPALPPSDEKRARQLRQAVVDMAARVFG
jgi:hypothetical protein